MKNKAYFLMALFFIFLSGFLFWRSAFLNQKVVDEVAIDDVIFKNEFKQESGDEEKTVINDRSLVDNQIKKEVGKVPFTSQAPSGNWSDEHFQNGCEEASIAMAMQWLMKKNFVSPDDAQREIVRIADFEEKMFNNYIDNSLDDIGIILTDLYEFENFHILMQPDLEALRKEINAGNIILVPTFGRALKNPNYTAPGPITHMLVVIGWDEETRQFITNDPGTRHGAGYRYDENVLHEAMWSYPSGKIHPEPPEEITEKSVLVIRGY